MPGGRGVLMSLLLRINFIKAEPGFLKDNEKGAINLRGMGACGAFFNKEFGAQS